MTSNFKTRVYDIVAQIPEGQVMTYGQIAALCGRPRAARVIGTIAKGTQFCHLRAHSERTYHYNANQLDGAAICSLCSLPWHRVVKKGGKLAEGYPGGVEGHKKALQAEGVKINKQHAIIDINKIMLPIDKIKQF